MTAKKECGLIEHPDIKVDTITHHLKPDQNSSTLETEWTTFSSQGELCAYEDCPLSKIDRQHNWDSESREEVAKQVQIDLANARDICPRTKRNFLQNLAFQVTR